jgi:hypothetical protein
MKTVKYIIINKHNEKAVCVGNKTFEAEKDMDIFIKKLYDIKMKLAFKGMEFTPAKNSDIYRKESYNRTPEYQYGKMRLTKEAQQAVDNNIYGMKIWINQVN